MEKNSMGLLVVFGIIAFILMGGIKNTNLAPLPSNNTIQPQTQNTPNIEQQIQKAKNQVSDLEQQIQLEADKKDQSQYKDIVSLAYISRSTNPSREYVTLRVNNSATSTIPVTGWILKSLSTGNQVTIPQATYLFFTGMLNVKDNILLTAGETLYLVTGVSPIGASFKVNKCSGYLGQFQTFVPYLSTVSCPLPRDEDLSSIPHSPTNDACFDFIDSVGQCMIVTDIPPTGLSPECINFIQNKISYPSCVNTHRSDKDFYQKQWRVYLGRGTGLWKSERETVVLYDNDSKIVDSLNY